MECGQCGLVSCINEASGAHLKTKHSAGIRGHKRCFLEIEKLSFSLYFLLTIIAAEQFIVPPAGLPNQGLLKKHSAK